jgi:hypothetical protein
MKEKEENQRRREVRRRRGEEGGRGGGKLERAGEWKTERKGKTGRGIALTARECAVERLGSVN